MTHTIHRKGFASVYNYFFYFSFRVLIRSRSVSCALEFLAAILSLVLSVRLYSFEFLLLFNKKHRYHIALIITSVIVCTENLIQMQKWMCQSLRTKYVSWI